MLSPVPCVAERNQIALLALSTGACSPRGDLGRACKGMAHPPLWKGLARVGFWRALLCAAERASVLPNMAIPVRAEGERRLEEVSSEGWRR